MRSFAGTTQRATERGSVLLMATVTILIVIGMLALAVDVGYLMNARGQVQNVVDAAALAGAQGLRVAIEPSSSSNEQVNIINRFARDIASFNQLRLASGATTIQLANQDILIDTSASPARITIKSRLAVPTIFGNVFGISSMTVSTAAITSTTVVDGGTGFVSGCWRPILMPDTFFDKNRNVWSISEPGLTFTENNPSPARKMSDIDLPPGSELPEDPTLPTVPGDHYISRFASVNSNSDRNQSKNFLQVWPIDGFPPSAFSEPTGIRDARRTREMKYVSGVLTGRNLMGQRMKLRPQDWRIINFTISGITGNFPTDPVQQINKGCCTPIRVGHFVKVYPRFDENAGLYNNFTQTLRNFYESIAISDISTLASNQYKYAQTHKYPTPNATPRAIPVLLCSPIEFASKNIDQFYVTNIAVFYLEGVGSDGSLIGHFLREIVTGGTPLQAEHEVANPNLLPVSVNLIR